jgi:hypothetical protein
MTRYATLGPGRPEAGAEPDAALATTPTEPDRRLLGRRRAAL